MARELAASEIASLCGGHTGSAAIITRVSGFERATADALVFAEDERSLAQALGSAAGIILAPLAATTADADDRVIAVRDPRYSFALCGRRLRPERQASEIHPSAVVHASVRLGERVCLGAGVVIEADAVLGNDVTLGSRVTVGQGVRLGHRVVVQAGAVLGSTGFGYVRDPATGEHLLFPQQGDLVIEDDVEIGANTTIDRGALGETRIGRGTKIDNLVQVGHNCSIGRNVIIASQVGISGSTVIGEGAVLAGQVGISAHCRIGPGVILGGQAGVYSGKAVEGEGKLFAGTPAEPLRDHLRALAQLRRLR